MPRATETPRTMHASDPRNKIHRPIRRSGRVRCGDAVAISAAATASLDAKYSDGVSALKAPDRSVETSLPIDTATSAMNAHATSSASSMSRKTRLRPCANSIASMRTTGQTSRRS